MGCLKKILQSVILCFAIIGFVSIGGDDFIKNKWSEFQSKHPMDMSKKINQFGDFSQVSDEFEISKTASMLGYNGLIAEHKASEQKFLILDSKNNELITPDDIINNRVESKITKLTSKFKYSAFKIQELKLAKKGKMIAYGQTVPYVRFSAKITKLPLKDVDGIISSYKSGNQTKLLISVNEKNKYSQLVTQEFFRDVKLPKEN